MEDRETTVQKNIDYLRKKQATQGWQAVLALVVLLLIGTQYIDGIVIGFVFFGCLMFLFYMILQYYAQKKKIHDAQIAEYEAELEELRESRRRACLK